MSLTKTFDRCHLMVALPCEAAPLVKHFRMQRLMQERAFVVYQRDDMFLTVTGPGKSAMAAGLAYSFALTGKNHDQAWFNVGIAGSRDHQVGDAFIAHKVSDLATQKHWFPGLAYDLPCATEWFCTVDRAETEYSQPCLYDMEVSAFFEIGARLTSLELLQSVKVVSDHPNAGIDQINANQVSELVDQQIPLIEQVLSIQKEVMGYLPGEIIPQAVLASCHQRWHLSAQQSKELRDLLNRWMILSETTFIDPKQWPHSGKSKAMLAWLRQYVDDLPCVLGV